MGYYEEMLSLFDLFNLMEKLSFSDNLYLENEYLAYKLAMLGHFAILRQLFRQSHKKSYKCHQV